LTGFLRRGAGLLTGDSGAGCPARASLCGNSRKDEGVGCGRRPTAA